MPSFCLANGQHAVNHTVIGVRVRSKIVPAVTEVRELHPAHSTRPSPNRQLRPSAQRGLMKPPGQRSHSR